MAGERRYIGIAEEATFGVIADAVAYLDFRQCDLDAPDNPYLVFEGAGRSLITASPGAYIPSGSLEIPVDYDRIGYFLKWALGRYLTTGTAVGGGASTTVNADASAGATQLVVDDEAGFQVGDYVELSGLSEVVQIQVLDGGGGPTYTWTLETALRYDHAAADTVDERQAPFTHIFLPRLEQVVTTGFTLRVGKGLFEHTFLGCVISRLEFSLEREHLMCRMDISAKKDVKVAIDTTSKSFPSSILNFRNASVRVNEDLDGGDPAEDITQYVQGYSLEVNNNLDNESGIRFGSRFLRDFEVGGVDVSGTVNLVFRGTAEYERFWAHSSEPQEAMTKEFILENVFTVGTDELSLIAPRAHWTRITTPVNGRNRIAMEAPFMSVLNSNFNNEAVNVRLKNNKAVY